MTTSGGGMLVTDDQELAEKARYRATQAREPLPWYEHEEVGFNYRMSNILAALGRVQLERLPQMIASRRRIREEYYSLFAVASGIQLLNDPSWGPSNAWLSCIRIGRDSHPGGANMARTALEKINVEARPVWKPMHQQPVFAGAEKLLTGVADEIFSEGLCLPSGSRMTQGQTQVVVQSVLATLGVNVK